MKTFDNITPEDPRLTAYALGELTDPAEITAIEQAIAQDPQLAAVVEDIRATAELLGAAFVEDASQASSETEHGRAQPTGKPPAASEPSSKVIRFPRWAGQISAAAAIIIVIGGLFLLNRMVSPVYEVTTTEMAFEAPEPEAEEAPQALKVQFQKAQKQSQQPRALEVEIRKKPKDSQGSNGPILVESTSRSFVPETSNIVTSAEVVSAQPVLPMEELDVFTPQIDNRVGVGSARGMTQSGESIPAGPSFAMSISSDELLTITKAPESKPTASTAPVETEKVSWNDFRKTIPAEPATSPSFSGGIEEAKSATGIEQSNLRTSSVDFFGLKAEPAQDSAKAKSRPQWASNDWQRPSRNFMPEEPSMPADRPAPDYRVQTQPSNTEGYLPVTDNAFLSPLTDPLSTFSIDVDTASYANVRRYIDAGQLPPPDAVRIEELVNYFPYAYPAPGPEAEHPLACYVDAAPAPWAPEHRLVRVGMKAQDIAWEERPSSNLVFLIDVSGSMNRDNKLPLVKDALAKLIRRLDGRDRVAIVVYAGSSGLVLPSTTANNAETIQYALDNLKAGGSTNGGEGLLLAYKVAKDNLFEDGNNRVILCTDGDFNVGVSDKGQIADIAAERAKDGIYLTVLGFGMGNLKDDMLETLSNRGNGNYAYIDSEREARKVFVEQAAGTLLTVAKDVKIQVEFNPAAVQAYRLIGYENRILAARDFNDDTKDAGEVGAGHTVTALYEVVPVGVDTAADSPESVAAIDPLKYQRADSSNSKAKSSEDADSKELLASGSDLEMLTVKMRYKLPEADTSTKLEFPLEADAIGSDFAKAAVDFRFAAAVAEFGMVLRNSPYKGTATLTDSRNIAEGALGSDPGGYRGDFVELLEKTMKVKGSE